MKSQRDQRIGDSRCKSYQEIRTYLDQQDEDRNENYVEFSRMLRDGKYSVKRDQAAVQLHDVNNEKEIKRVSVASCRKLGAKGFFEFLEVSEVHPRELGAKGFMDFLDEKDQTVKLLNTFLNKDSSLKKSSRKQDKRATQRKAKMFLDFITDKQPQPTDQQEKVLLEDILESEKLGPPQGKITLPPTPTNALRKSKSFEDEIDTW